MQPGIHNFTEVHCSRYTFYVVPTLLSTSSRTTDILAVATSGSLIEVRLPQPLTPKVKPVARLSMDSK